MPTFAVSSPIGSTVDKSEVVAGNFLTQIAGGTGTTTSATEAEIWTKTFTAGDFAEDDICFVVLRAYNPSGNVVLKLRATATSNADITVLPSVGATDILCRCMMRQRNATNTVHHGEAEVWRDSGTRVSSGSATASMTADWITGAWTLSCRGSTSAAGTLDVDYAVYRMEMGP